MNDVDTSTSLTWGSLTDAVCEVRNATRECDVGGPPLTFHGKVSSYRYAQMKLLDELLGQVAPLNPGWEDMPWEKGTPDERDLYSAVYALRENIAAANRRQAPSFNDIDLGLLTKMARVKGILERILEVAEPC